MRPVPLALPRLCGSQHGRGNSRTIENWYSEGLAKRFGDRSGRMDCDSLLSFSE